MYTLKMSSFFAELYGFLAGVIYCSFFEWTLHRYVMHRPVGKFVYPFRAHALVHHQTFRADDSYHLQQPSDQSTVPMAWWNAPLLMVIHVPLALLVGWLVGHPVAIAMGALSALAAYYATYEYIHWCMHIPRQRNIERSGIFFRLNGHHLLHHRYMGNNFNVVFPLADAVLGTLVLRSRVSFAQATGPSVPNVQPPAPTLAPAN